jgi:hypothetical protein
MSGLSHYTLNKDGGLDAAPAATEGFCIAYLIERDGKDVLCVMEGGAYHQFDISPAGTGRLAAEAANAVRKHVK